MKDISVHQYANLYYFFNNSVKRESILCDNFLFWCITGVPGILSVKPDHDLDSTRKDYSSSEIELNADLSPSYGNALLFPVGTANHWLVRMERPAIGVIRKAQVVDYYVQILMRVLRK